MKEYFSIGELAELFGLNIQTLYYYDSVGIFSPRERNEKNGRRKYEFDQIYELATVSYMRRLGYSLEEIKESRTSLNSNRAVDIMKQRSQELRRQWQELLNIDEAIQRKGLVLNKYTGSRGKSGSWNRRWMESAWMRLR